MSAIHARLWTLAEDKQLRALRSSGLTWPEIGKRMDRSDDSVSKRFRRIAASEHDDRAPSKWTDEEDRIAGSMLAAGYSLDQIAAVIGRSERGVYARLRSRGRLVPDVRPPAKPRCDETDREMSAAAVDKNLVEACRLHLADLVREHGPGSGRAAHWGSFGDFDHDGSVRMPQGHQADSFRPSNLTALFCGDPLPGRSALDQRRAMEAGR